MLILTRGPEQSIRIGPDITITIVRVRGDQVRIGIDAPKDVKVLRDDARHTEPAPASAIG